MGQVSDWLRPLASEPLQDGAIAPLPSSVQVSVILTTCDRPTDLRNCLRHLLAQVTPREVEIIVADNRPASGITPPIVAEFPGVKLVSEPRVGGSYGRNTAFCASTGEIVATVDDDVTVPPDWLENSSHPWLGPR
ncbi:MAG: glycosyltransferase family 2 protein [Synechococcales cyanobacterium RU_4_20]|nr:glycosyltransferase family 2 protein [Synechococcales cyanobacterium RU_4_20]